jgi:cell division initiation protein
MELTPQAVAGAQFSSVRKGYDPDEVRAFLAKVARGIDSIQTAAGAADARAKTAEAEAGRLREEAESAPLATVATGSDDTEQMSRVLLLAQRTADAAVGEAQQEARAIVTAAEEKARTAVADAESRAAEVLAAARAEAREAGEVERTRVAAEVAALDRRRSELGADVDRLGGEMATQRERLIAVVETLRSVLDQPIANRRASATDTAPAHSGEAPKLTFEHPAPDDERAEPAGDRADVEPSASERPTLRAVEDDVTGEFEPVTSSSATATREELRDALADRFFDQGTFEDERWKPKS